MAFNRYLLAISQDAPMPSDYQVADWVDVTWFGAVGDGSTDDTSAIQAAIAAAPTGGILIFPKTSSYYKISSALTISKSLTIKGSGTLSQITAFEPLIKIRSSNITVDGSDGLTLTGRAQVWPATNKVDENAIDISGTFNAGLAPTNLTNITIKNVTINNWGDFGIVAKYVSGFTASGNTISNIVNAGIALISVTDFRISDNWISNVTGNGTNVDSEAYGIQCTRITTDSGNLTSQPNTADGVVSGNIVDTIPTWNGIDTHSGENISFSNNNIYGTKRGYAIGSSKNSAGTYTYPPLDISISGGVIDSGVTNGSYEEAVSFTGASGTSTPATGSIVGLTVRGYGNQSNSNSGAFVLSNTLGVTISGNTILYPSPTGIALNSNNRFVSITGNTIVDSFSNTVGVAAAYGIRTTGSNNSINASGNIVTPYDKVATYLLSTAGGQGIRIGNGTGNSAIVNGNKITATTQLVDVNGVFRGTVTANAATPVVVAAPAVAADSIILLTPTSTATGKGAFISDIDPGTGFSINSTAGDTSVYNWQIVQ